MKVIGNSEMLCNSSLNYATRYYVIYSGNFNSTVITTEVASKFVKFS